MKAASGGPKPHGRIVVAEIVMKDLLESGVHFGHQTRRWNPKMKRFIFMERNRIYIIDLHKTLKCLGEARAAIEKGEFASFRAQTLARLAPDEGA